MIEIALTFCVSCFAVRSCAICGGWPSRRGVDRVLALDTVVIDAIALLNLYGIVQETPVYFEVSMLIAMVGFVSTVACCRFVLRGTIIE